MDRFQIEPQRDIFKGTERASEGTCFEHCDEAEAENFAVFDCKEGLGAGPALLDDFPTREAAQAYIDGRTYGDPMAVQVAAVRLETASNVVQCDEKEADAFAVYILNPLAFHVADFGPSSAFGGKAPTLAAAKVAAFAYADALADHCDCDVIARVPRPIDPLAGLSMPMRAWLVDEMGMVPANMGGNCYVLEHAGPGGWHILVSAAGEPSMPSADDWQVSIYPPENKRDACEPIHTFTSEPVNGETITLRQAINLACDILVAMAARIG